jgi:predicted negative regulator of RcsB-dependent stress response
VTEQTFAEKMNQMIVDHGKLIVTAFGVFILAGAVYMGWDFYNKTQEAKAQTALYQAENKFKRVVEKIALEAVPKDLDVSKEKDQKKVQELQMAEAKKKADAVKTADISRFQDAIESYKTVMSQYGNRTAASQAALELARMYSDRDKTDEAIAVLQEQARSGGDKSLMSSLVTFQLGNLELSKGNYTQAIDRFGRILSVPDFKYLHPEASLKMGIAYEGSKDLAKAKEFYQKTIAEFATSDAAKTARKYMRLLEMSQGSGQ